MTRTAWIRAVLLSAVCLSAGAAPVPPQAAERQFLWEEANARMAAAQTVESFDQAAQAYQRLIDSGVRNGPLYYNLGTALLRANQPGPAIAALQRAEQYLGADPALRRNLRIALARQAGQASAPWPWYRVLFFWHFGRPAAWRAQAAAGALFVFFVLLTLRLWGSRREAWTALLALSGCAALLFGCSLAVTWHQERPSASDAAPLMPADSQRAGAPS